jgi:hypothetical protein
MVSRPKDYPYVIMSWLPWNHAKSEQLVQQLVDLGGESIGPTQDRMFGFKTAEKREEVLNVIRKRFGKTSAYRYDYKGDVQDLLAPRPPKKRPKGGSPTGTGKRGL